MLTITAHLVGMLISGFITFAALGITGHTDSDSINDENMTGISKINVDSLHFMLVHNITILPFCIKLRALNFYDSIYW